MARDVNTFGNKLLPKIVKAVSEAVITTKRSLMPTEHHWKVKATQDVIDKAGREIADLYRPLVDIMLEAGGDDLSPAVRAYLEDAKSGEHQVKAAAGLLLGGGASAISTFLSNELAPFVYSAVASNPHLRLDPATAAQLAAEGVVTVDTVFNEASAQGIDNNRAGALLEGAYNYPALADAAEMRRRNLISDADYSLILERNGIPARFTAPQKALDANLLSLADAALAYLRSDITLQEAQKIASDNGFTNDQLNIFIGNTGEPPGLQQLVEARRRGFIDAATLVRGIKQSRVRDEWIATIEKLAFEPMSVADAVNAFVQDHIDQPTLTSIANENGLEPGQVDILAQTAGEPLSRTEATELVNRGLMTDAEFAQDLRESRLKNKYIPFALELRRRLIEPRMLSTATELGVADNAYVIQVAKDYGYDDKDAQIIASEGSLRKLQTYRDRVLSAMQALVEDNILDISKAESTAKGLGYTDAEIKYISSATQFHQQAKLLVQGVSVVRSKYIGRHITKNAASGSLDALGIPAAQRDTLIKTWQIEHDANVRTLTEAQIAKAVKLQLITPQEGLTRLVNLGYVAGDAALLLEGA